MICSVCCNRNILYRPIPTLLRKVKWPVKHDIINLKWPDYSTGCTLTVRHLSAYALLTDYSRFTVRHLLPIYQKYVQTTRQGVCNVYKMAAVSSYHTQTAAWIAL